jgi:hypothetical protein
MMVLVFLVFMDVQIIHLQITIAKLLVMMEVVCNVYTVVWIQLQVITIVELLVMMVVVFLNLHLLLLYHLVGIV